MVTRRIGVVIAMLGLLLGVAPAAHGHRCISMKVMMPASHECCPRGTEVQQTTVSAPCCETTSVGKLVSPSILERVDDPIAAKQLVGVVQFAPAIVPPRSFIARGGEAPFRPPGDRLHRLSTILRI